MGEDGAALLGRPKDPGRSGGDNRRFVEATMDYSDRQSLARPSGVFRQMEHDLLVPLHRGYDGLKGWQDFWVDEETDAARAARLAADEAFALEGEHHLMDGRRSDGEEALDVGFGGRPSEGERIGMNKG
jgi:hypothetical protein